MLRAVTLSVSKYYKRIGKSGHCLLVAGDVLSPGPATLTYASRLKMSDAAPFIAPALLVAYLAIGGLLFWGRAVRR